MVHNATINLILKRRLYKNINEHMSSDISGIRVIIGGVEYALVKVRTEKPCSKCKVIKPMCEFNENATRSDHKSTFCKVCTREAAKESYLRKKAIKQPVFDV